MLVQMQQVTHAFCVSQPPLCVSGSHVTGPSSPMRGAGIEAIKGWMVTLSSAADEELQQLKTEYAGVSRGSALAVP